MLKTKSALLLIVFSILCVSTTLASSLGDLMNSASKDFKSSFGQMEKVFPEKYDEILSRLYRPEDRIVYIFREMTVAQFNQSQKKETMLNGYLKKALNRYWLLESNEFKKVFLADSAYYQKRAKKYLAKLPSNYDQAAFYFLFDSLSKDIPSLAPFTKSSANALDCLKDIKHQQAYALAIENSKDFYRKIPLIFKKIQKIEDKIDAFIEKLQQKFLLEKMILACDHLIPQKDGKMKSILTNLKSRLGKRLLDKIISNLEVQLETGLESDAVTGIMKSSMGVMVSQTLYQGRIRTFIKELQKAENIKQLNCYLEIMSKVKNSFGALKSKISDPRSKETLDKMSKNFENISVIMKLKLRNQNQESNEFKSITSQFEQMINTDESNCLIESE